MTIPDWWQAILLALAAYRLTRLGGWDAWPPAAKLRARLIGQEWASQPTTRYVASAEDYVALIEEARTVGRSVESLGAVVIGPDPELPGKQPSSPIEGVRPGYRHPTLAHLVHCPFCLGWWVSLACWGAFQVSPHWTLVALSPFALAGAVGLIGKDLD